MGWTLGFSLLTPGTPELYSPPFLRAVLSTVSECI